MADQKPIFVTGMFFNDPNERAPEFVLGSISIKPKDFVEWMREQREHINEKGYLRLQVLRSKQSGKPYVAVDTWKPEAKPERYTPDDKDDDIPF